MYSVLVYSKAATSYEIATMFRCNITCSCGHLYHASCLGVSGRDGPSLGITCVVCNKSSAPSGHTGRLPISVSSCYTK